MQQQAYPIWSIVATGVQLGAVQVAAAGSSVNSLAVQDAPCVGNIAGAAILLHPNAGTGSCKGADIGGSSSMGVNIGEIVAACCGQHVCVAVVDDVQAGLFVVLQPQHG